MPLLLFMTMKDSHAHCCKKTVVFPSNLRNFPGAVKDYEAEGYSITSGFTVRLWADNSFQNPAGSTDNPAMKDTASKDDVTSQQASCDSFIALKNLMSWSDRLFFYIQGLRMLCRQNIFSAYDGHLLKLDEQGVLFHFECENTDTITDVLWNAFSTVYYKSYQEKLLLHGILIFLKTE